MREEIILHHELDEALKEADIETGDYKHRLSILVEHFIRAKRPSNADELRRMAETIANDRAESEYGKGWAALFKNYYSLNSEVVKLHEAQLED